MAKLDHTRILRGGITSNYSKVESSTCSFWVNARDNSLDFDFQIASKGGGTTCLKLQVGIKDLSIILQSIAKEMPENAILLSDCASIANKHNFDRLVATQQKLKNIERIGRDKYWKGEGADEKQNNPEAEEAKKQLWDVLKLLEELLLEK
jgi:hypothetical protein